MTSIVTNASAISALQNLQTVSDGLDKTQKQVSTGYRVATASDNVAYWSIATTMRSDNKGLSAAQDASGVGAAKVAVAYSGMTAAIDVMQEVKVTLVTAKESSVDRDKVNENIEQLRQQIYSIVDSSSFAGENWLHRYTEDDDANQTVVAGFTRDSDGVAVDTLNFKRAMPFGTNHLIDEVYHNGILTNVEYARQLGTATEWTFLNGRQHDIHPTFKLDDSTTTGDIDDMISVTEWMLKDMTTAASDLGSLQQRIDMQANFASKLSDSIEGGVSRLVDTDLEDASARLAALQTQQQLSLQSLQIANSKPQNILSLFS